MSRKTDQIKKVNNGKLKRAGGSGDGKRVYLVASNNDGDEDLRIDVDTDDYDRTYANRWTETMAALRSKL